MVPRTGGYAYAAKVWDLSIVQGTFSVAPCQNLTIRFATFSSLYHRRQELQSTLLAGDHVGVLLPAEGPSEGAYYLRRGALHRAPSQPCRRVNTFSVARIAADGGGGAGAVLYSDAQLPNVANRNI